MNKTRLDKMRTKTSNRFVTGECSKWVEHPLRQVVVKTILAAIPELRNLLVRLAVYLQKN